MLEKPDLDESALCAALRAAYELRADGIAFLPLGADVNTAVYRVVASGAPYFVKLRRGAFDEISVALPRYLHDVGIAQVMAPLPTLGGALWTTLQAFTVIVYPFVQGRNGYEMNLQERHWATLGAALQRLHTISLPAALAQRIPRETYSPQRRRAVQGHVERADGTAPVDDVAAQLLATLRSRRAEILGLVARADALAEELRARALPFVLCHADIHAGNILVGDDDVLYVVDWDAPIHAPVERDLMSIGADLGGGGHTAEQEETWFLRGYGPTQIDRRALAYYRYERIIADIAAYCEQLLVSDAGGEDRAQGLRYFTSNFAPGGTIAMARRADREQGDA
jgi:spectinomycin phosphotransferase